jgi:hypothetical protein
MKPSESNLRAFRVTLAVLWAVAAAGGVVYGRMLELPAFVLAPVLAACLLEISLYVVPGFEAASGAIRARWSEPALALGMTASAAAPYCLYAVPTGTFHWTSLGLLLSLAAAAVFFYLWMPKNGYADAVFLAFMAAVVLSGCFKAIYPMPAPRLRLEILGQMMWTRTGVMAMLWFRRAEGIASGSFPRGRTGRWGCATTSTSCRWDCRSASPSGLYASGRWRSPGGRRRAWRWGPFSGCFGSWRWPRSSSSGV